MSLLDHIKTKYSGKFFDLQMAGTNPCVLRAFKLSVVFYLKFDTIYYMEEKCIHKSLFCLPSATNASHAHECFKKATKQVKEGGSSRQ